MKKLLLSISILTQCQETEEMSLDKIWLAPTEKYMQEVTQDAENAIDNTFNDEHYFCCEYFRIPAFKDLMNTLSKEGTHPAVISKKLHTAQEQHNNNSSIQACFCIGVVAGLFSYLPLTIVREYVPFIAPSCNGDAFVGIGVISSSIAALGAYQQRSKTIQGQIQEANSIIATRYVSTLPDDIKDYILSLVINNALRDSKSIDAKTSASFFKLITNNTRTHIIQGNAELALDRLISINTSLQKIENAQEPATYQDMLRALRKNLLFNVLSNHAIDFQPFLEELYKSVPLFYTTILFKKATLTLTAIALQNKSAQERLSSFTYSKVYYPKRT